MLLSLQYSLSSTFDLCPPPPPHTHTPDSGIMLKKDMEQVFRDNEFPIKWKEEYIRLMTIFEVVVEIDDSQLLIPSHVKDDSLENPFLSLSGGLVSGGEGCW